MLGYRPLRGVYDEAFDADGSPRPHYEPVIDALAGADLESLGAGVEGRLADAGVTFGASEGGLLALDPVPRLLTGAEWATVADGITQRARALESFARDVYADRAIVEAGVVPARVIEGCEHFEPALRGVEQPPLLLSVVGFDLVRGPDGRFRVLEDQIRMPSGIAYAVAAREALAGLPLLSPPPTSDVAAGLPALGEALRAAAPDDSSEPTVALLSGGAGAAGFYEHVRIADELGIDLVTLAELERRGADVVRRTGASAERVDVVYLRSDEDRFTDARHDPTPIGNLLLEPCRARRVACVNAPGAGVGDDKLVHAYVAEMIGFYLGEEPLLESVETFDLGVAPSREAVLSAPEELVFKPRAKMGGEGVVVWDDAGERERADVLAALERGPERMIAQRRVELSTHPTICGGRLEPRRVDLRPYVIRTPGSDWVLPGGLTRVALEEGSLIVNSGQGGGVKDTWVFGPT